MSARTREVYEKEEFERLAPFAAKSAESLGRVVSEPEHPYRTAFQRDRDRIVHSRAFRRLQYKTQVFVHHEGDHFRNRLTHTLECSQIARSIARVLRLNEDLAEAVALAHDLGHTPFGHAGEGVLNRLLADHGGFDHNRQTLRIVDLLEERYPGFRGLNLTWETRGGLLKHGSSWDHPVPLPPATQGLCLEAQVADRSDEIAYTNHDLDDGLRSGLLTLELLDTIPLWRETRGAVCERIGDASESLLRSQTIVALINEWVTDLVETTSTRLNARAPDSPSTVRARERGFVALSPECERSTRELKDFLLRNLYHHPHVERVNLEAERILGDLFECFQRAPERLPPRVRANFAVDGEARAIADYIAGMTDRFATAEHERLVEGSSHA